MIYFIAVISFKFNSNLLTYYRIDLVKDINDRRVEKWSRFKEW